MKNEFLCFKYKGVPRIDELIKNSDDYGWKCRKYIRWEQVHNKATDKVALKTFGDSLLNNKYVERKYLGDIQAVFLNVQKWRFDKEQLSVEPERKTSWERLNIRIEATGSSPSIIVNEITQRNIELNLSDVDEVQEAFWIISSVEFFADQNYGKFADVQSHNVHIKHLRGEFYPLLKQLLLGYLGMLSYSPNELGLLLKTLRYLGFDKLVSHERLPIGNNVNDTQPCKVYVEYCELERERLMKYTYVRDNVVLKINKNHPFCQRYIIVEEAKHHVEELLKAIALSCDDMITNEDIIRQFTSYIGMHLLREI
ncbi:hypothetical protein [Geoalkalibacter halelectricus]|uniref:hypothetical protein n=1 Tax=Geoalkalibacter halelectricus TaxID=2847045 RepID=UPI00266FC3D1|nr:hypothetical protein [Geoalkalibacter halelectricus]MDO3380532.1 hypothetical protein [Geoalkalibacter halelectricus]